MHRQATHTQEELLRAKRNMAEEGRQYLVQATEALSAQKLIKARGQNIRNRVAK